MVAPAAVSFTQLNGLTLLLAVALILLVYVLAIRLALWRDHRREMRVARLIKGLSNNLDLMAPPRRQTRMATDLLPRPRVHCDRELHDHDPVMRLRARGGA